tara:strand:- start:9085 stop:10461 length:1377 start_codon:yes stop_codon:yes gene_type:complete
MARINLNVGGNANDGTGDTLRSAMENVNTMFAELYASPLFSGDITVSGNNISANRTNDDLVLSANGTGSIRLPAININDNRIEGTRTNDNINLIPNGTGSVVFGAIKINGTSFSSDDSTTININDQLSVGGTLNVTGTTTLNGATVLSSTLNVESALTTLGQLTVNGATNLVGTTTIDNLTFNDNTIGSSSNADINLAPGGTGSVIVSSLTVDSNINITDNEIKTTQSNSDLVIAPAGTGQVVLAKADINSGTIDATVIGATTPAAGTFTTLATTQSMVIDGVTIADNTITTNESNSALELSGNGTGSVSISGLVFPTSDGSANQLLKTDGNGNLGFATASATLNHSDINDNSATVATSAVSVVDSFATATYRSARYFISISDATNSRFETVEASVVHGPSDDSTTAAFLTVFGSTTNHSVPLCTFTADINDGNVRLLATNITSDSTVFKFQRVSVDV